MAIIGLFGALTLVSIVTVWCYIKALKLGLSAESDSLIQQSTAQIAGMYRTFLLAVLAFGFGPQILAWCGTVLELAGNYIW